MRAFPEDLSTAMLDPLTWSETDRVASVEHLFDRMQERAKEIIDWYMGRRRLRALLSQGLRLGAVAFATVGGLFPLVAAAQIMPASIPVAMGQLGYVAFAMAAGCVAIDRFFGLSTAWMRYMISALAIQRALADLQIDWAIMQARIGGRPPTIAETEAMLMRLKSFQSSVMQIIEQETQGWVSEFQHNLAELSRLAKPAAEPVKPVAPDFPEQPLPAPSKEEPAPASLITPS